MAGYVFWNKEVSINAHGTNKFVLFSPNLKIHNAGHVSIGPWIGLVLTQVTNWESILDSAKNNTIQRQLRIMVQSEMELAITNLSC